MGLPSQCRVSTRSWGSDGLHKGQSREAEVVMFRLLFSVIDIAPMASYSECEDDDNAQIKEQDMMLPFGNG
jgi:hypothetical protein